MYLKSLVVFAICTLFVIGFAVVLNYETGLVGSQVQALPSSPTNCSPSDSQCPSFTIVSASLTSKNTSDQLGIASPAYASLSIMVAGGPTLSRVDLFVGNVSAASIRGTYGRGQDQVCENYTLYATVLVTPGKTYLLSVEGFSGASYLLKSEEVKAGVQQPY